MNRASISKSELSRIEAERIRRDLIATGNLREPGLPFRIQPLQCQTLKALEILDAVCVGVRSRYAKEAA